MEPVFIWQTPPEWFRRSEEHTSELQSQSNLVCRLLLVKKNLATLTENRSIKKIAGIKLHTGLHGRHFQNSASCQFIYCCGISKLIASCARDDSMIVTTG